MSPREVHFSLMQKLPVRTVPERPKPELNRAPAHGDSRNNGRRRTPEEMLRLNKRVKALLSYGLQFDEVASELQVSIATVTRHASDKAFQQRLQAALRR